MLIAGEEDMYLSRIEGELQLSPSYTICILEKWRQLYGSAPALLIGADSLLDFHKWHRAAELVEQFTILTYPRSGYPVSAENLSPFWSPLQVEKLLSGLVPGRFFEISSTDLRKTMAKSPEECHIITGNRYGVPEAIMDYAVKHGLYEEQKNTMTQAKKIEAAELLEFCVACAEEKLARDVVTMAMDSNAGIADFFMVATADSEPQLNAVAGFIERSVRERYGLRSMSRNSNGLHGGWILLDFGSVVAHVMTGEVRSRYDLESLWGEVAAASQRSE